VGSGRGLSTTVSVWRGCWWRCAAQRCCRVLESSEGVRRHVQGTRCWRSIYGAVVCARCHPSADVALVEGWEGKV
jgi:hypothetical protein